MLTLSLKTRQYLARFILIAAIVSGGYVAYFGDHDQGGLEDGTLPPLLELLVELEFAHIAGHLVIFGSVAVLLGDRNGQNHEMAWRYVWRGAVLMELVQAILGFPPETILLLVWNAAFDLFIDILAAWLGLRFIERWSKFRESKSEEAASIHSNPPRR